MGARNVSSIDLASLLRELRRLPPLTVREIIGALRLPQHWTLAVTLAHLLGIDLLAVSRGVQTCGGVETGGEFGGGVAGGGVAGCALVSRQSAEQALGKLLSSLLHAPVQVPGAGVVALFRVQASDGASLYFAARTRASGRLVQAEPDDDPRGAALEAWRASQGRRKGCRFAPPDLVARRVAADPAGRDLLARSGVTGSARSLQGLAESCLGQRLWFAGTLLTVETCLADGVDEYSVRRIATAPTVARGDA